MSEAIGIDIGGTATRAALVYNGEIVRRAATATPRDPRHLAIMLRAFATELGSQSPDSPPIGVAIPGIRDPVAGVMLRCFNLPRLEGLDIPAFLTESLGRPPRIETDVNAAALAQWTQCAAKVAHFIYLSIGTGIGGGIIMAGRLAAESGRFGQIIVDPSANAPAGRTGIPGCLEAVAAGPAWNPIDSVASNRAAEFVAIGLCKIIEFHSPDVIALGGGVLDHRPGWFEQISIAFESRRAGHSIESKIVRAPLASDDAGVIGAALLALS